MKQAENKCKLFAWILIQNKILTADNLAIRGWPHQDACILCNGPLETGHHLCLGCTFAQATWSIVTSWEGINLQPALQTPSNSLVDWWESASLSIPKEKRRDFNGMAIYTMWNLWKERNRRIFDNKYSAATQVAERTKEDIEQYKRAFATAH
jgi:hypothetical protein